MSRQGRPEVVARSVSGLGFGFYSAAEAVRLSVKRIREAVLFDNLRNPVPGGLYDPALGPLGFNEVCGTCRLGYLHCPGHLGHIALPLPVYHPLLFPLLLSVLRCVCLSCHRLRVRQHTVQGCLLRLRLLNSGRVLEALHVAERQQQQQRQSKQNKRKGGNVDEAAGLVDGTDEAEEADEEEGEDEDEGEEGEGEGEGTLAFEGELPADIATAALEEPEPEGSPVDSLRWSWAAEAEWKKCVRDLWRAVPGGAKCGNCGAANASIRREGGTRLVKLPLSKKMQLHNLRKGIVFPDVLSGQSADLEATDDSEEELESGGKRKRTARGTGVAEGGSEKPMLMSVVEVQEHMRRFQRNAPDLCALIFGGTPGQGLGSVQAQGQRRGGLGGPGGVAIAEVLGLAEDGQALTPAASRAEAGGSPSEMFFVTCLLVPPNKFRPAQKMHDEVFEHPQNVYFQRILETAKAIEESRDTLRQSRKRQHQGKMGMEKGSVGVANGHAEAEEEMEAEAEEEMEAEAEAQEERDRTVRRMTATWAALQQHVNCLMDSSVAAKGSRREDIGVGIRQQLERKEGLFRMNMMGKRVNFACRSVISPDPNIQVHEIGVPPYFAMRLSYPEHATSWNFDYLRLIVENGPWKLPGATHVEDERGNIIALHGLPAVRRRALARTLLSTPSSSGGVPAVGPRGAGSALVSPSKHQGGGEVPQRRAAAKVVYRHLRDGDVVLVNRQPTLHRPGIMAHRVRLLKGEQTLRLHYANCNVYNADFDGDEMNVHFPQDPISTAEAMCLVDANLQYILPTNGLPARGLIQDHVIAGTLLSLPSTLLSQCQFQQLLFAACIPGHPPLSLGADRSGPSPTDVGPSGHVAGAEANAVAFLSDDPLKVDTPPTFWKPHRLWTGKQLLSALLKHVSGGQAPMTMSAPCKVSAKCWGGGRQEDTQVRMRQGDFVTGSFDKAQFGKFGVVHCFYELYGADAAGRLLSCLSRLFTAFLQMHGFTCGVDDLLLTHSAEVQRRKVLAQADEIGPKVQAEFANVPKESARPIAVNREVCRQLRLRGDAARVALDNLMTSALSRVTTAATGSCLPGGLRKGFPHNCMLLMTVTGAKGSAVNFNQISVLLGQQELEGRRVPRMASGKTLPCFQAWDAEARAGGFISDRFLSGLKPQEFFFHCMAGRDGLVDTTVKTSRSGYLQRCLVKNLEGLRLHYDSTVRDDADGGVVQFRYGEDALDVTRTAFLNNFQFLEENAAQEEQSLGMHELEVQSLPRETVPWCTEPPSAEDKAAGQRKASGAAMKPVVAPGLEAQALGRSTVCNPTASLGVVPPSFARAAAAAVAALPGAGRGKKGRRKRAGAQELLEVKFRDSLAQPGEPVGVLAAQSIGEPSTQMTLNTFHFAGRGEANVTLGIPRLREILMTAAKEVATPVMLCPLRPGRTMQEAEVLASQLRRMSLAELVQSLTVREAPSTHPGMGPPGVAAGALVASPGGAGVPANMRQYTLAVKLHPLSQYPGALGLCLREVQATFKKAFLPRLEQMASRLLKRLGAGAGDVLQASAVEGRGGRMGDGEEGEGEGIAQLPDERGEAGDAEEEDEVEGGEEDGHDAEKRRGQATDERAYDEDEGDEGGEEEREAEGDALEGSDGEEVDIVTSRQKEGPAQDGNESLEEEPTSRRLRPKRAAVQRAGTGGGESGPPGGAAARKKGAASRVEAGFSSCTKYTSGAVLEATLAVPAEAPPLLVHEMAEKAAAQAMVRSTRGIVRASALPPASEGAPPRLQVEGLNFQRMWDFADDLDLDKLSTNHIAAMLNTYGVEAACSAIVKEVRQVFEMYGIGVNVRHLSLVADFMTQDGTYRACNRLGIGSNPSPLLKMSFETATSFLTDAASGSKQDQLKTPSSRIVLGQVADVGTGSFDLLHNIS